ncbi:Ribonuclease Y [Candidatus Protochlamydia amoebophila]|uniref:ribonuclease Y n=1 Tax=Candidatus Protochlamydia amoebophila TaxID=362787 RepID=UPI001BC92E5A|nr:ribonuclease Y [Candidatus Protochlamydia amoebophila]MBS4163172.1 Ribonuclease Y [Candidatus Protochlamydia amoebophila]
MIENQVPFYLLIFLVGIVLGVLTFWAYHRFALGGFKRISKDIISRAEQETSELRKTNELSLKQKQVEYQRELEHMWQQERKKLQQEEERLKQREDKLEIRMNLVEKKLSDTEKREAILIGRKAQLDEEKKQTIESHSKLLSILEKASGLTSSEAKEILLSRLSNEVKTESANLIRRIRKEAEEEAEKIASTIIATSINRLAVSCASESTVCTVTIPNEDMKGRIIGREGRNIRALERETGVNFIIDDTPGAVVLSGFDPVRKHIAKMALTELVQDGRIHPTRIEEVVEKATINVHKQIKQYGEDAALRAGAMNLHPDLINLLGKLKFRFSYGQNVLDHSLEVSHLMGLMAAELGLDIRLAKRIGLLHDLGKAVTHEIEGSHAIIGHDLALKLGENKEVANGIGCHHHEMAPLTIEADLCSAADAISASREGARIEAVEEYIKRLRKLEEIALEFAGVDKAYAMQAGREIRIVVLPEQVDDAGVVNLARDLTKRIEQELSYPGKIKVTVIREKRVVEYAV